MKGIKWEGRGGEGRGGEGREGTEAGGERRERTRGEGKVRGREEKEGEGKGGRGAQEGRSPPPTSDDERRYDCWPYEFERW
jgi:hypothetical protein